MKRKKRGYLQLLGGLISIGIGVGLILLLQVFETEQFIRWYSQYTDTLVQYELWMETYGASLLTVLIIALNYFIKSYIPWFPASCLCVACAVVFKWYIAAAISFAGFALFFTVKFYKGRKKGGGKAEQIIEKYKKLDEFIENGRLGSKAVLFIARLLPAVPLGQVSVFYGSTEMAYGEYLLISLAGSSYKIFSYITIGRHVFDPASASFIVPFIPLFFIAGLVLLTIGSALRLVNRNNKKIISEGTDKNDKH